MSDCTSGCPTKDCGSYGDCLRNKRVRTSTEHMVSERHEGKTRDYYREVRQQGIQPATSKRHDIDMAVQITNETGKPFRADK